jgi:bifunctional UDP-N-acetylglucosamine pyrophosphorylase/glucosamine-1-phosphate N-acetyltransferase
MASLRGLPVTFAVQEHQLGTGHAVLVAEDFLPAEASIVLILCGDTPLVRSATLARMLDSHRRSCRLLTVMTTILADPTNYGRIVSGGDGSIERIVEQKDASPDELAIAEINAGIYCVDRRFLFAALAGVDRNNSQGEMYLTDIVGIARKQGHVVGRFRCEDAPEVLGVNSRIELAMAEAKLREERNRGLMASGVTLIDPATAYIGGHVVIGRDTVIEPCVSISGESFIGEGCRIGSFAVLENCSLGRGVVVAPLVRLAGVVIEEGRKVCASVSGP